MDRISTLIIRSILFLTLATLAVGCSDDADDGGPPLPAAPEGVFASPEWVKTNIIDSNNNGNPYVIVQFAYGSAGDDYNNGHIPGAIWVNSDEIEYDCFNARSAFPVDPGTPPCYDRSTTADEDAAKGLGVDDALPRNYWNWYPQEYLLPAIAHMGIDKDTTVVAYSPDPTMAARFVMTLRYAGVAETYIINGGYAAWQAAGYEGETTPNERVPVADFGLAQAASPAFIKDAAYVRRIIAGEVDAVIADVRTQDEWSGATAPYDYIPPAGRIANAVYAHGSVDGPYDMKYVVNEDGTLKSFDEIRAMWEADGVPTDRDVVFYCGTGWRAAISFFIAEALGWQPSYYEGGWMEWSMGPETAMNPMETDNP